MKNIMDKEFYILGKYGNMKPKIKMKLKDIVETFYDEAGFSRKKFWEYAKKTFPPTTIDGKPGDPNNPEDWHDYRWSWYYILSHLERIGKKLRLPNNSLDKAKEKYA